METTTNQSSVSNAGRKAQDARRSWIQLHISVFLWGFTAILGKLISLHEVPLVWYRILFTCTALLFIPGIYKKVKATPRKDALKLAGIGCLVSLHWVCFYGSIKYSNVSIALSCLATTSFIASFIEPLINKKKISVFEMSLGLLVIPGMAIIVHFSQWYATGIILGLSAAFIAAIFTVLNKTVVLKHNAQSMTFIELFGGLIFLSILMPVYLYYFPGTRIVPSGHDLAYLLILSLGCTALPFILSLKALRHLSAFASTLTLNLEPVYGIILAIPFFHENKALDWQFYLGTGIILAAVFIHAFLVRKRN